jgi:hypothetical protein
MAPSATGSAGLFRTDVPSGPFPGRGKSIKETAEIGTLAALSFLIGLRLFRRSVRGDDIEILAT